MPSCYNKRIPKTVSIFFEAATDLNIYFIFKNIYFTDVIKPRACTYTHVKLYVNIRILVTTFVLFYAAGSVPHILE